MKKVLRHIWLFSLRFCDKFSFSSSLAYTFVALSQLHENNLHKLDIFYENPGTSQYSNKNWLDRYWIIQMYTLPKDKWNDEFPIKCKTKGYWKLKSTVQIFENNLLITEVRSSVLEKPFAFKVLKFQMYTHRYSNQIKHYCKLT